MKQFLPHHFGNWKDTNIPMPFPGKYPTRIMFALQFHNGHADRYQGKPNLIAAKRYLDMRRRPDVEAWWEWEFDRGNVITRRSHVRSLVSTHSTLGKLYHPFRAIDGIAAFAEPFFRKRISGFTCYSPYETLKLPMVKEHKAWLVASGIVKGKPLPQMEVATEVVSDNIEMWQCPNIPCGYINAAFRARCGNCDTPNPNRMRPNLSPTRTTATDSWQCPCGWWNGARRTTCCGCEAPRG